MKIDCIFFLFTIKMHSKGFWFLNFKIHCNIFVFFILFYFFVCNIFVFTVEKYFILPLKSIEKVFVFFLPEKIFVNFFTIKMDCKCIFSIEMHGKISAFFYHKMHCNFSILP